MYVFTGSSNQLRILIGLERNCQQMRWLVENEIPPCFAEYSLHDIVGSVTNFRALFLTVLLDLFAAK
jgi:hypothetical protein